MADEDAQLEPYPSGRGLLKVLKGLNATDAQAVKSLVLKLLFEVSASNGSADAAPARINLDEADLIIRGLSLLTPRAKFDLALLPEHLVFTGKQEFSIPYTAVKHVAILDNIPQDKTGKVLLFLALSRDVTIMHGKQRLEHIIIQMKADAVLDVAKGGTDLSSQPAAVGLCMSLGQHSVTSFINPDQSIFTSSKGDLALEAVVKVNSGWLFPLADGLLFIERPAQFLPRDDIKCVQLPRMGTGQTFDLLVHMADGSVSEFIQISMAEADRLGDYLQRARIRIGSPDAQDDAAQHDQHRKHSTPAGAAAGAAADDDEEDSDDEDDEDFDPDASSDDEGPPAKRAKTGPAPAAAAAAEAGSEDIGDSDEDEDEDDEDDEYETDAEMEPAAAGGAGASSSRAAAGGEEELEDEDEDEEEDDDEEEDEDEDEDSDEDADLVDEEGISAANMKDLIAQERPPKRVVRNLP